MNRITLKDYAVKHKLSIFNVMKMIRADKLKSEEVEEEGKNVLYIILDDKTEEEVANSIIPIEKKEELSLREEINLLKEDVRKLREELASIKAQYKA